MSHFPIARVVRFAPRGGAGLFAVLTLLPPTVLGSPHAYGADAPKPAAAAAPAVLVSQAQKRPLARQSEFIGRVEAIEKVELRARVQGFLMERKFEAGADVAKDQVLFALERAPFEAALAQRKAQLAAAEATQLNAAAQLQRYKTLENKQVASEAQLDLKVAEEGRARASVLEAKAAIQDAEIQLSYTEIKAPIAGRIGRSSVDPGNLVGPESGVLATLVRTDEMHVLFPVTQIELMNARRTVGDKPLTVQARLADGSFLEQRGKIDFVDVSVDARTDGQLVRAVFPNPGGALTDGQTVRVVIEQTAPDEVVTIPLAAVATDQGGQFVYVVTAENTVEQRRVKLGVERDGFIAVADGVTLGERVIVQGQQRVRPGVNVKPEPMADVAGSAAEAKP